MKTNWGVEVYLHVFLTSAVGGGKWSASCPGHFIPPGKEPPSTHWIGVWVGPRAGLDTVVKTKKSLPTSHL
jgi:hypothetical protein